MKTEVKVGEIGICITSLAGDSDVCPGGNGTEDFKQNSECHG